ncbi:hypothetical protein CDAR_516131 [Caerostris darwini]|uniref:Uncharacterized protein n=1 Tax=Caerostris darwini TaxID=1538125 RepID=A0AAV4W4T9_9ARAC|nr:hypothetical protein CDAR_516131 [Caerostris darwini]
MSAPSFRHYLFQLLQLKQGGGNSTQLSHSWIPRVSLKKAEIPVLSARKELRKNRVKEWKRVYFPVNTTISSSTYLQPLHYSKVSALPERYINSLSELYILDNELTDVMGDDV